MYKYYNPNKTFTINYNYDYLKENKVIVKYNNMYINDILLRNIIKIEIYKTDNDIYLYGKYYNKSFCITIDDSNYKDIQFKLSNYNMQWGNGYITIEENNKECITGKVFEWRKDITTGIVTFTGLIENKEGDDN